MASHESDSRPWRWDGGDPDGDNWCLEIEVDRFKQDAPLVVSIWVEGEEEDGVRFDSLVTATPEQAREMAATLIACADSAERQNAGGPLEATSHALREERS